MKFLAWFSCGVTSAVACKLAIDKYGDDVDIWYIETGAAHSDNQRFIEDCENWYGRKILTARHPKFKNPLEIAAIEVFNTPWGAPCTKYLKKEVRQRIEKNYTQPIHVFGFEYNKKEINRAFRWKQQNSSRVYFPLIEQGWNKRRCLQELLLNKIEIPAMYRLGYNNNNCIGCFKGGKGYWNKIRTDFPDVFRKTAELELKTRHTCLKDRGKQLFLAELEPDAGKHQNIDIPECGIFCELEMAGLPIKNINEILEFIKFNPENQ